MTGQGHKPHWPDKAMFASIMLILGGLMGTLFASIEGVISFHTCEATDTNCHTIPAFLTTQTQWLQLGLSLATLVFGFVSLRAKRKRFALVGCVTGLASLGFVGLVPILSLIAAGFLVQARREGELADDASNRLTTRDWPDKALAASLFLLVAGVLTVLQGILIGFGAFGAILMQGVPTLEATFDLAAGGWCAYAAWQVYHLRRPWTGFVAVALGGLALGLYVIGPVLAVTALALLLMANRENEFTTA